MLTLVADADVIGAHYPVAALPITGTTPGYLTELTAAGDTGSPNADIGGYAISITKAAIGDGIVITDPLVADVGGTGVAVIALGIDLAAFGIPFVPAGALLRAVIQRAGVIIMGEGTYSRPSPPNILAIVGCACCSCCICWYLA